MAYSDLTGGNFEVYRQADGGSPQLIGVCECANGNELSMSRDGSLIAYGLPPTQTGADSIDLYDAAPGIGAVPLVISNDGSSLLYDAQTASPNGQLMIDQNGRSTAAPDRADSYPESASLTDDGSSLRYTLWYKSTDSRPNSPTSTFRACSTGKPASHQ